MKINDVNRGGDEHYDALLGDQLKINPIATTNVTPLMSHEPRNCRRTLWYLIFFGFMIDSMMRISISMSIVDMTLPRNTIQNITTVKTGVNFTCGNCSAINFLENNLPTQNSTIQRKRFTFERVILDWLQFDYNENGFDWNEYQQGLVLGAFYWLNWLNALNGGIMSRKYGTKLVYGMIVFISGLLSFVMPISAFLNYKLLIAFRVVQGFLYGGAWSSMHTMIGKWVPPNERSKFVSAYMGNAVGMAVFYALFGWVISVSSWEWVFHICGVVGITWSICWEFLIYDSPSEHPHISSEERIYIEKSLGSSNKSHENLGSIPWRDILTSGPVWVATTCQIGVVWCVTILGTQAPTYFKTIHGWNIRMSGILSGLPYLLKMGFSYIFASYADYLLRGGKLSRTNVRKIGGGICNILQGVLLILLAFSYHPYMAVVFYALCIMVQGATSSGSLANFIDLSPNFSGVIMGIAGTFATMTGYINPLIVGVLTLNNQTLQQWRYVFILSAAVAIITGIIYILFAKAVVQSWNKPRDVPNVKRLRQHSTSTS